MKLRLAGALTATVLTAAGLLSGCGGSEPAPAPSTPAAAPSESAPQPSAEATGAKPKKELVIAGYAALLPAADGQTKKLYKKVTTCLVNEVYDDASPQTLNALADKKPNEMDPADVKLFTDAQKTCTTKVTKELQKEMGGGN